MILNDCVRVYFSTRLQSAHKSHFNAFFSLCVFNIVIISVFARLCISVHIEKMFCVYFSIVQKYFAAAQNINHLGWVMVSFLLIFCLSFTLRFAYLGTTVMYTIRDMSTWANFHKNVLVYAIHLDASFFPTSRSGKKQHTSYL